MKIAIFGASGFVGYNFFRRLVERPEHTPVVYCTSAQGLTNLSRHDLDLRFSPYSMLEAETLDSDVECLVNFGHPFQKRDELTPAQQVDAFARFLGRCLDARGDLKVIHLSSMSVFEPFAQDRYFEEADEISPPATDSYAATKARMERKIAGLPSSDSNFLVLRPTVVYGPFCRPWTDGPMAAFKVGDVTYTNLDGRIQPISGSDICRFITDRLGDFRAGTFNMPGPETITWFDFLRFYQNIVDEGALVRRNDVEGPKGSSAAQPESWRGRLARSSIQAAGRALGSDRLHELARRFPEEFREYARRKLGTQPDGAGAASPYDRPFFSQDRLVSGQGFAATFPDFEMTRMPDNETILREYYRYRFTDAPMSGGAANAVKQEG